MREISDTQLEPAPRRADGAHASISPTSPCGDLQRRVGAVAGDAVLRRRRCVAAVGLAITMLSAVSAPALAIGIPVRPPGAVDFVASTEPDAIAQPMRLALLNRQLREASTRGPSRGAATLVAAAGAAMLTGFAGGALVWAMVVRHHRRSVAIPITWSESRRHVSRRMAIGSVLGRAARLPVGCIRWILRRRLASRPG